MSARFRPEAPWRRARAACSQDHQAAMPRPNRRTDAVDYDFGLTGLARVEILPRPPCFRLRWILGNRSHHTSQGRRVKPCFAASCWSTTDRRKMPTSIGTVGPFGQCAIRIFLGQSPNSCLVMPSASTLLAAAGARLVGSRGGQTTRLRRSQTGLSLSISHSRRSGDALFSSSPHPRGCNERGFPAGRHDLAWLPRRL